MTLLNPLTSSEWHRVAGLRPTLAGTVSVTRTWSRHQRWYVLHDRNRQVSCRLNEAAYAVAARLDGHTSLSAIWQQLDSAGNAASAEHGDLGEPLTQDEVVGVIALLQKHALLAFDTTPGFGALMMDQSRSIATDEQALQGDNRPDGTPRSLLAWRMPLGNPDTWLTQRAHWAKRMFSRTGGMVWLLCMVALLLGLLMHGEALQRHAGAWLTSPRYALLSVLLYPLIKAAHELSHAMAIKRWGGSVRDVGVTWMLLMPVPYVNAAAAQAFVHPWQRALVSGAGIMCELMLACVGLWVWQMAEPGLIKDTAFVLWFIACASTLLFNANPLQRLDGYHVMTELLQLPNLATRSSMHWQSWIRQWLGGIKDATERLDLAPASHREHRWLVAYAPLALAYQWVLWLGLCWWVAGLSAVLGMVLAGMVLWRLVLGPGYRVLRTAWQSSMAASGVEGGLALGALGRLSAVVAVLLAVMVLPWPDRSVVQGVIWAPEEALIRAQVDGLVNTVHVSDGQDVKAGQLLLTLYNPQLLARREGVAAKLAQAEQAQYTHMGTDGSKAGQAQDEVQRLTSERQHMDEQLAQLEIRAQRAGRLVWPAGVDLPGQYAKRGRLLGQIIDQSPPRVKLAVAHDAVGPLHATTRSTWVRLNANGAEPVEATLQRDAMGATMQLPHPALSQALGGDIITDPKDQQHLTTLRPVVVLDVQLNQPLDHVARLGERAWVRLDHGWSSVAWRAWRWTRQRLLQDVSTST